MIHSNICESEKLSLVSYPAETLYYRLLTRVDDNGNFTANPRVVFGQCMTLREDMTPKKVESLLEELATVTESGKKPLIEFYDAGGDRWLHITKFEDFQYLRPDRTATIKFPAHPNQMGPVVPTTVNQTETSGKPNGNQGWPKLSKEKLSKEKESEESFGLPPGPQGGPQSGHEWKRLATRFREVLGKFASKTKSNQKTYADFCTQYGEDKVIEVFEEWATQNKSWLVDKDNALYFFWRSLPENVEAVEAEQERKSSLVPPSITEEQKSFLETQDQERTLKVQEAEKEAEKEKAEIAASRDTI